VLKVACVNQHDLTDPDAFGGRLHYMMRALQHRRLSLEFLSLSRRRPVMSLVLARKLYHEHLGSLSGTSLARSRASYAGRTPRSY
jgi:hypothetical protein